mgnify:CR=1 FL=1
MTYKQEKSTDELLKLLFKQNNLDRFFCNDETSFIIPQFHEYISALCKIKHEIPAHIIADAGLEKSFGYQLFSGKRKPSRDTVIQLAFGFRCTVDEAQQLLKISGLSVLYPRVKRDSAIIYCLYNNISFVNTQLILEELKLPILGGVRYERGR